jgi:hypothetical protein
MRNPCLQGSVVLLAALACSSVVAAQTSVAQTSQAQRSALKPVASQLHPELLFAPPQNREIPKNPEPAGPAPKHDLNGAWVGPTKAMAGKVPPLTPLGEKLMKLNKPEREYTLAATNDPFQSCDPLGLPRNILNHPVINAGMWFEQAGDRIVMLYQYQRVWRDIWMDGRQLPAKVDAKAAPDARFYGYSVGHWDGDTTLVIDSTGVDDRTWIDDVGHPHSSAMHVQERYTRLDQYTLEVTITIDDPAIYTQPFQFLKANYVWMVKQDFPETFCVPSEALAYRDSLARPAGTGDSAAK